MSHKADCPKETDCGCCDVIEENIPVSKILLKMINEELIVPTKGDLEKRKTIFCKIILL